MPTLSKKGQETRHEILMAAFELFQEHGVHETSVDDILKKSGAGKSQFYHYFKGKDDIIHAILEAAREMILSGEIHLKPIHSWDDFRAWLDAIINKQDECEHSRICPIGKIGSQISHDNVLLRQDIQRVFEALQEFPKRFFISLQAKDEMPQHVNVDTLADFCVSSMQGAIVSSCYGGKEKALQAMSDHLYDYVKSLCAPEK